MKIYPDTVAFFGADDPFSNFHYYPFVYKGVYVPSSEHAFMLAKAEYFGDTDIYSRILEACRVPYHPKEVKRLGRKVAGFDAEEWELVKEGIMYDILKVKFELSELRGELLKYGLNRKFVEASPWDTSWGVGLREDNPDVRVASKHRGKNLLGRLLDRLYKELVESTTPSEIKK